MEYCAVFCTSLHLYCFLCETHVIHMSDRRTDKVSYQRATHHKSKNRFPGLFFISCPISTSGNSWDIELSLLPPSLPPWVRDCHKVIIWDLWPPHPLKTQTTSCPFISTFKNTVWKIMLLFFLFFLNLMDWSADKIMELIWYKISLNATNITKKTSWLLK